MSMVTERLINQMQGQLITYELHHMNETLDAMLAEQGGSVTHTTFDDYLEQFYTDRGYRVSFQWSGPATGTIDIYYIPGDFSTPDETNVSSAVTRNPETGNPDSGRNGMVFLSVNLPQGYYVDAMNVQNYGSHEDEDTGKTIFYIEGITNNCTATIVTTDTEPEPEPGPVFA